MSDRRDPVEAASDAGDDLYDIATWEPRTQLDRVSVALYRTLIRTARGLVIFVALVILIAQFAFTGLAAVRSPIIGAFVLLSIVPAFAIVAYVWRADITRREPLNLLVATYLLGILLASFAAILNTIAQPFFAVIPIIGMALFFFIIVGPVEETVKWLAIRLYAYRSDRFDAVLDGAVYGAVAGLGFATIENALYISQQYFQAVQTGTNGALGSAFGTAAVRTFAGPGHVLYSAFAGYYLGLAKFNRDNAGPIVVKGLLIAAVIHGLYNTLVGIVPSLVSVFVPSISVPLAFIGFVIVFDGIVGYALYRKIARYRHAYRTTVTTGPDHRYADSSTSDELAVPKEDNTEGETGWAESESAFTWSQDDDGNNR